MIVLPDYDDQTYEEIVETVRRKIPVIFPEWTDLNEHDPGFTLIELFAWLKEMEQYSLNRITNQGYESMLKVLGKTFKRPSPSKTIAVFRDVPVICRLPSGYRIRASGNVPFECERAAELGKYKIECAAISDGYKYNPVSDLLMENDLNFNAFGEEPRDGISALYLGLTRKTESADLSLYVLVYDNYPVARNPFLEAQSAPRRIAAEYAVKNGGTLEFVPAEIFEDETHAFSVSGGIHIRLGKDARGLLIDDNLPECIWLRFRLLEQGCEESPRIISIFENSVELLQRNTQCETLEAKAKAGRFEMVCDGILALHGNLLAFVRDNYGWSRFDGFSVNMDERRRCAVRFDGLPEDIAADGENNLRIVCCEPGFQDAMLLPGSTGLPGQRFRVKCDEIVLTETLQVMAFEQSDGGDMRWFDYRYVSDLSSAGPLDRVFGFDLNSGELIFGDNVHGCVPERGEDNILIVSCSQTAGSRGNILAGSLEPFEYAGVKLEPCNLYASSCGGDGDDIKSAVEDFHGSLNTLTRAVTLQDYEKIAACAPGLRVLSVKAIPCFDPDSSVLGGAESPAMVTVVVMPYSESPFPKPDGRFIAEVRRYLENYRMITTELKVIAASFVQISVYAEVVLQDSGDGRVLSDIKTRIERLFDIQKRIAAGIKPVFGEPVRENTVVSKIAEVAGVNHVKKVTLGVHGNEGHRDRYGNILLPPYALAYLGSLEIRPIDFM